MAATECTYFGIELYGMSHSWRFHKKCYHLRWIKNKMQGMECNGMEWNGMEYVECNGM